MIQKAFDIITKNFNEALADKGYTQHTVNAAKNDLASLFTGEKDAYSILYSAEKKQFILQACAADNGEPDNNWKTLTSWLFDEKTDTEREAISIANDFIDTVKPARAAFAKQPKRKKNDDDGNADPQFFAKRLVAIFPELKDEIRYESECYSKFRGVTFTREKIVPKITELLATGTQSEIDKLAEIISAQHTNADMDTRSIISIVILNSIDNEASEQKLRKNLSEEVIKSWDAAKKMKGKNIKPEKRKKSLYMTETLNR